ncbi:MAG: baseplate protein [Phototrophicales bacterium]|nr:MAG: baseplate protein [Phototrophicales bacterium]
MGNEFLGKGWFFPLQLDDNGQVRTVSYEEAVRQSIWMILSTAKGERVMRPDFGCGIHDLVFGLSNTATLGRVVSEVRQALTLWEPRIELVDVTADFDPQQPSRLLIYVDYVLLTDNSRFNLVYPFYLE